MRMDLGSGARKVYWKSRFLNRFVLSLLSEGGGLKSYARFCYVFCFFSLDEKKRLFQLGWP